MNREIKFRAYVTNYRDWDEDALAEVVRGKMFEWETHKQEIAWYISGEYGNGWGEGVVIMQYTGLKDKHGVEIYEGDVVEIMTYQGVDEAGNDKELSPSKHLVDDFGLGDFIYMQYHEMGWDSEDVEVIGNKFENPELLNLNLGEEKSIQLERLRGLMSYFGQDVETLSDKELEKLVLKNGEEFALYGMTHDDCTNDFIRTVRKILTLIK